MKLIQLSKQSKYNQRILINLPLFQTVFLLVTIPVMVLIVVFNQRVVMVDTSVACTDFKTQKEAQKAFENGATWLDGNGDLIACNSLK